MGIASQATRAPAQSAPAALLRLPEGWPVVADYSIWFLDCTLRAVAWLLSFVSRVKAGGVFRVRHGTAFVDLWREGSAHGSSWTLRLGRVEFIVDFRAPAGARRGLRM